MESLLPACPARDDLLLVADELAANAVRHTASGNDGRFATEITWSGTLVRVAVTDGGASGEPHLVDDPMAEHGRGLCLVKAISRQMGMSGDTRGRTVWAEIAWDGPGIAPADHHPPDTAAIAGTQAELTRRFSGVVTWFGLATQQWWALARRPGADCLLTAPLGSRPSSVIGPAA
ncbi:ATP-binding protein [Planomonospora sp. ID82291]|nr:ATP-binding protein [Planomonospora sp. ID82291]MBG0818679.1 ATP-binding protein [Planomonospora sp. ID82291]